MRSVHGEFALQAFDHTDGGIARQGGIPAPREGGTADLKVALPR